MTATMSRRDPADVKHHRGGIIADVAVMVVSGLLYGTCFPPFAWRWLAWVVLLPALFVLRRCHSGRGAFLGGVLASAGAVMTVAWLPRTVNIYFHQPIWLGWLMFAAVVLLMVVPPYAVVGAAYGRLCRLPTWMVPPAAASAWVAGEFFRSSVLTGNPWVLWGYSQSGVLPIMQIADITGVYGVTWLLALVSFSLVELMARWSGPRAAWPSVAVASACLVVALAYGEVRLARTSPATEATTVLIVQDNLDLGSQWHQDLYGRNLETYLRATLDELRKQPAALVVWPESAMTFFVEEEPAYQASIGSVLGPHKAQLVVGGPHRDVTATGETYFNSAFLIDPSGRPRLRYDKQRLLPFAEYFPFAWSDLLQRDFGKVRQFTAAAEPVILPTVAGPAGVVICNEAMFPDLSGDAVRRGAQLLINLTNDTWVSDATFSGIAFDMARFRAVEQRRYLVRASTAGPSAIVAPSGVVEVRSKLFTRATVRGSVHASSEVSVYERFGDVFAWVCVAIAIAALLGVLFW